jgi:methyl-accepting chemotaxis protein
VAVARWEAALATAAAVLLLAGLSWGMGRSVVDPLRATVEANGRLASGDLGVRLDDAGRDELAAMARSFNEMAASLRRTVRAVQAQAAEVARSSGEISAGAEETAELVAQLNIAIDQVTAGSQDQAQSAQETAEVMDRMAEAVRAVAADAREVAGAASASMEAAQAGGAVIARAIGSMDDIRRSVAGAEVPIRQLDERSREIGAIVDRVAAIAAQTNLLALNAAIEAARAGEHGRGFAVVAEEVRKLADLSERSSGEIATRLAGMREGAEQVAAAMAAGARSVAEGTGMAREAGQALDAILASLGDTDAQARRIAASATTMAASLDRLGALVESVAGVAEESAAAAEEMAAQSAEVAAAIQVIGSTDEGAGAGSAHALSRMAADLERAVAGFRLTATG